MADAIFDHEKLDIDRLALDVPTCALLNGKLKRIVAMLTRLAMPTDRVSEPGFWYDSAGIDDDHEHEHRCAEHE